MKLYIKNYSSYTSDEENIEIKKVLKQKYKLDTRRQDSFIHLAVYGGQLLKEKTDISVDDELYLTSGVGNIDIIQKTNTYIYEENQPLKLFDFINLLGNTTSYYVASSLGVKGKNIFQISDNFTYINSLISIFASISNSGKNAILCSIDLVGTCDEAIKRVLGVDEGSRVLSSVNYQKFSLSNDDAIAELEFDTKTYSLDEVKTFLENNKKQIVFSPRFKESKVSNKLGFFETIPSYSINESMKNNQDLTYIDCFEDRYKILKLKSLK